MQTGAVPLQLLIFSIYVFFICEFFLLSVVVFRKRKYVLGVTFDFIILGGIISVFLLLVCCLRPVFDSYHLISLAIGLLSMVGVNIIWVWGDKIFYS